MLGGKWGMRCAVQNQKQRVRVTIRTMMSATLPPSGLGGMLFTERPPSVGMSLWVDVGAAGSWVDVRCTPAPGMQGSTACPRLCSRGQAVLAALRPAAAVCLTCGPHGGTRDRRPCNRCPACRKQVAREPIMAAAVYCIGGGGCCCGNVGLLHRGRGSAHEGARGSLGSELPFQLGSNAGFSNAAFRAMRAWQSVLHRAHVPAAVQVPIHVLLPWPGCRQVAPSMATHVPSEAHLWHSGQRESSHCIERAQVGRGSRVTPMVTCGEQHRVATVGHELIDGGRPTPGPRACLALSNAVAAPIPHSVTGTLGGDRHIHMHACICHRCSCSTWEGTGVVMA